MAAKDDSNGMWHSDMEGPLLALLILSLLNNRLGGPGSTKICDFCR